MLTQIVLEDCMAIFKIMEVDITCDPDPVSTGYYFFHSSLLLRSGSIFSTTGDPKHCFTEPTNDV